MKKYGLLYHSFLVWCVFAGSVPSQERIFVGSRLDGSAIGPYKVKSFDRFYDQNKSLESRGDGNDELYSISSLRDDSNTGTTITESYDRSHENMKIDSSPKVNGPKNLDLYESYDNNLISNMEGSSNHLPALNKTNLSSVLPSMKNGSSNFVSPLSIVDENVRDESIDFELFSHLIERETDRQNSVMTSSSSRNVSFDLTVALEEVSPIAETTTSVENVTLTPPQLVLCHASCTDQLEKMVFKYTPKTPSIQSGGSLSLECSVPFENESSIRIIWLFQKINPPSSQCSLTPQESIHLCNNFATIEHIIDSNYTSKIAAEKILLSSLTSEDSGYYFCLVELTCCSQNPHVMQLIKKTETPIEVYEENYVLELSVLGGLVGCLLVLLTIGTYLQKKRRRRNCFPPSKIESPARGVKDVLHAPILGSQEDSDSFEESGDES